MISFVTHPYHRGGVTAWTIDAVNYLVREGQELQFIGVQPRRQFISGSHRPLIADLLEDKKIKDGLPLEGIVYELGTPNYRAWVLAKEILRKAPLGSTLIPSDDEACWLACAMLADRYRFLGVVHSDDPVHYQIFDWFYPYLSGIVTISNRIARNLPAVGLPVLVAPCGIVLPPSSERERQRYKLVYVGRLEEQQKRISDLIPIIALVRRSIPNIQLEIWGHGDAEVALKADIQAYGMGNSVVLKGWGARELILDALAEATMLVQVSNFEGMSIAVMEAMAMGCMVVSSEVSGVEDYARTEVGRDLIRLYPIGDRDAAAKAIIEALTVYDLGMAPKARAFAEKHFSIATCMQTYSAFADNLTIPDGIQPIATPSVFDRSFSRILACLRYLKYKLGL